VRRYLHVRTFSERVRPDDTEWARLAPGGVSRALTGRRLPRAWRVSVTVDSAFVARPWEARLLPVAARSRFRPIAIWRTCDPQQARPARAEASFDTAIQAFAPDNWLLLMEDGWGRVRGLRVGDARILADESATLRPSRILHVIGTPVLTNSGWRLRVDTESSRLGDVRGASDEYQMLVSPERLARINAGALIVQATPGTPNPRYAEGLRAIADAAMKFATPLVLTVPALPPEAALPAIRAAARHLRRGRSRLGAQLRLAGAVRASIVRELSHYPDMNRRAAVSTSLDVCLFLRPEER
jgi:hypothetical protein